MRLLARSVLLLSLMVLIPAVVHADTVTLKLINTLPDNSAGGVYVYPYNFSINGSSTLIALLCDDYNDEVKLGESWIANVNTLAAAAAGAGHFGATSNYYKAGWLFEQLLSQAPNASPESINWAIWKILSPSITVPSSVMGSSSTQGTVAWWLAQIPTTINTSALSNIVVYTWDGNTNTILNGPGGPPQEYFGTGLGPGGPTGTVPEPASVVLMLTGCGAIFLRRRKHAGSSSSTSESCDSSHRGRSEK